MIGFTIYTCNLDLSRYRWRPIGFPENQRHHDPIDLIAGPPTDDFVECPARSSDFR